MERYYSLNSLDLSQLSNEELYLWASHIFEAPKAFCDLVLVLVPESHLDVSLSFCQRSSHTKVALDTWLEETQYHDIRLDIERHWIPHQVIYLPDTTEGQAFYQIANAIGKIPINADIQPRNKNQAYWLKMLHGVYQVRGLVFANQFLKILKGQQRPKKLLARKIGFKEIGKLQRIVDSDLALYRLISAAEGAPSLSSTAMDQTRFFSESALKVLVHIKTQEFIRAWAQGSENAHQAWIPLKQQADRLTKQVTFLRKLGDGEPLTTREEHYREELNASGEYGAIINTAATSRTTWFSQDLYDQYVDAFASASSALLTDMHWVKGEPHKLERIQPQRLPKRCSSVPDGSCDCPFRFMGADLNASVCIQLASTPLDAPNRARLPQPVIGNVDLLGHITWRWHNKSS
jgi:hypothetical protein